MYPDLKDKVVIVTGAGRPRGIGRATALRFAEEGAKVVVADLDDQAPTVEEDVLGVRPNPTSVVAEIESRGGRAIAVPADVSDKAAVERLMNQTLSAYGGVDIMVCNAATEADFGVDVFSLEAELFARIQAVNLTGTFLCAQAAARRMVDAGTRGSIVTIGSRASKRGNPNIIAYSASKFGVLGLSQSLALALAPHGVRVNCVCPGAVDTDMAAAETAQTAASQGVSAESLRDQAIEGVPLGRLTVPEDLANAIAWLASSQSAHLTGQSINVNGGTWLS